MSIFSSREAEAEQRTLLLKRIAFLLFCSDSDQYQQFMPSLQGEMLENIQISSDVRLQPPELLAVGKNDYISLAVTLDYRV